MDSIGEFHDVGVERVEPQRHVERVQNERCVFPGARIVERRDDVFVFSSSLSNRRLTNLLRVWPPINSLMSVRLAGGSEKSNSLSYDWGGLGPSGA